MYELKQVSVRLKAERPLISEIPVDECEVALRVLGEDMYDLDREEIRVVFLDALLKPIAYEICAVGSTSGCMIKAREIFKAAFLLNADAIIIMHNHPNGSCEPSIQDNMLTEQMQKACSLIGMRLVEHIIVSSNREYFSYADKASDKLERLGAGKLGIKGYLPDINLPGMMVAEEK